MLSQTFTTGTSNNLLTVM